LPIDLVAKMEIADCPQVHLSESGPQFKNRNG
jgi:hypothetical protein